VTRLGALERLDLQENGLRSLPSGIGKLTALRRLNLVRNPISAEEKTRLKKALPECQILF